jgi:putative copper export protein
MVGMSEGWELVRLSLHVAAATVWVGGQLVLAALVPALRRVAPDAPRAAAQAFQRVAWPAFVVLVATGLWNVVAERDDLEGGRLALLWVKLCVVLVSGVTAWLHSVAHSPRGRAIYGAATGASALLALVLGVGLAR